MDRLQVVTRGGLTGVGQQYFSPSAYHAKWAEHPGPCSDSYLLTHRSHRTHSTWRALWTLQQKKRKRWVIIHHLGRGCLRISRYCCKIGEANPLKLLMNLCHSLTQSRIFYIVKPYRFIFTYYYQLAIRTSAPLGPWGPLGPGGPGGPCREEIQCW